MDSILPYRGTPRPRKTMNCPKRRQTTEDDGLSHRGDGRQVIRETGATVGGGARGLTGGIACGAHLLGRHVDPGARKTAPPRAGRQPAKTGSFWIRRECAETTT